MTYREIGWPSRGAIVDTRESSVRKVHMGRWMTLMVGVVVGMVMVATCGTKHGAVVSDMGTRMGDLRSAPTIDSGHTSVDLFGFDSSHTTSDLLGQAVEDLLRFDLTSIDVGVRDAAAAPTLLTATCSATSGIASWVTISSPGLDPRTAPNVSATMCDCSGASCSGAFNSAPTSVCVDARVFLAYDTDKVYVRCGGNGWTFANVYVSVN